jgi:hypothetical protein
MSFSCLSFKYSVLSKLPSTHRAVEITILTSVCMWACCTSRDCWQRVVTTGGMSTCIPQLVWRLGNMPDDRGIGMWLPAVSKTLLFFPDLLGTTQSYIECIRDNFWRPSGWGVTLATIFQLASKLRMGGAIHPLRPDKNERECNRNMLAVSAWRRRRRIRRKRRRRRRKIRWWWWSWSSDSDGENDELPHFVS